MRIALKRRIQISALVLLFTIFAARTGASRLPTSIVCDLRIEIVADPARETLQLSVEFQIDLSASPEARQSGEAWFLFTEPASISELTDKATGERLEYPFSPLVGSPSSIGIKRFKLRLPGDRDRVVVAARYT